MIDLVVVLILIASNGFFAMSEMAVVTAKPARLRSMGRTRRGARVALEMTAHPERFLSAVQVWITLLGLLTGFFGGDYLGYEAMHGIDWVWEHRIDDLVKLGL